MSFAPLLLPFALLQATDVAPPAPVAQTRLEQCVAQIDADAAHAYEEAMAWAADAHETDAYRCAAMALIAQGRIDEGARRLESLAAQSASNGTGVQAALFSQAGNAYLLDHAAARARSAFTQAIVLMRDDREALPDLLIDRARAYAMERDWRHSEEDLSHALDLRADDSLALRLRATARMQQRAFELAEADAQAAVALTPMDVDARLVLGNVREARRTGPDEGC